MVQFIWYNYIKHRQIIWQHTLSTLPLRFRYLEIVVIMAISFEPLPSDGPRRTLPLAFYRPHIPLESSVVYTTLYASEAAALSCARHMMNPTATAPATFSIGKISSKDLELVPIWVDYPSDMSVRAVRLPVWARAPGAKRVGRRSQVMFCMNEVRGMLEVGYEPTFEDEWVFLNRSMQGVTEEIRTYDMTELEFGTTEKRRGVFRRCWALLKENLVTKVDWTGYKRRKADSEVWLMMRSQRSLGSIRE